MLRHPHAATRVTPSPSPDALALAGTVAARMCHDLAGTLGALNGTLELAFEEKDAEALRLSAALAQDVVARLRLLRGAWGSLTDLPDWESLLPGLPGAERLHVDVTRLQLAGNSARQLTLSLILVAAASLPRCGRIEVSGIDRAIMVEIEGVRAGWPDSLRACLTDETALLAACESPRDLTNALACLLARAQRRRLTIEGPTRLTALS